MQQLMFYSTMYPIPSNPNFALIKVTDSSKI